MEVMGRYKRSIGSSPRPSEGRERGFEASENSQIQSCLALGGRL
jgi:hypothetical protein